MSTSYFTLDLPKNRVKTWVNKSLFWHDCRPIYSDMGLIVLRVFRCGHLRVAGCGRSCGHTESGSCGHIKAGSCGHTKAGSCGHTEFGHCHWIWSLNKAAWAYWIFCISGSDIRYMILTRNICWYRGRTFMPSIQMDNAKRWLADIEEEPSCQAYKWTTQRGDYLNDEMQFLTRYQIFEHATLSSFGE